MALSKSLVDQFTKISSPKKEKTPSVVKGTYSIIDGNSFVKIDGSNILTPVNILVNAKEGDKVSLEIKNHSATVIGNFTSPSANMGNVEDISKDVSDVLTKQNNKITAMNNSIESVNNTIKQYNNTIEQQNTTIKNINTKVESYDTTIKTHSSSISSINTTIQTQNTNINSINDTVKSQGNTIKSQGNQITQNGNNIKANNNDITILNSGFNIVDGKLTGLSDIVVDNLTTNKLNAKYADIDFANIKIAAVEKLFATSGIIKDLTTENQHITGELVGVTINGDLINANTLKADKLVVKGTDGLYYQLNLNGEKIEASQTDQNSLNGSIITAKSITASKIKVSDLFAFRATIGGFDIQENSINTHGKPTIDTDALGLYLGKDGQFYLGDNNSHLKFFKDTDNQYKLDIAASEVHIGASSDGVSQQLENLNNDYGDLSSDLLNNYTSLDNKINTTNNNLKDYATKGYADSINETVNTIKSDTYSKSDIDKKMWDGSVTKVSSLNGTFDNDGMHYYRKGTPAESTINENGVKVTSAGSGEELLFAGYDTKSKSTIVRTDNLTTRHYLIVGEHSRIQSYGNNGGGVFII